MGLTRWTNIAVSVAPLLLLWLGQGSASPLLDSLDASQGPALRGLVSRAPPELAFTYRGSNLKPEELRKAKGFHPSGDYARNPRAYILERQVRGDPADIDTDDRDADSDITDPETEAWSTAYVSTAVSPNTALRFGAYLYEISTGPHMFTLPPEINHETEVVALGGIWWSQVRRWRLIDDNSFEFPNNQVPEDGWTDNEDFDGNRWNNFRALATIPEDWDNANSQCSARRFMRRVGADVGWTGRFPLLPPRTQGDQDGEPAAKKPKPDDTAGPSGQVSGAVAAPEELREDLEATGIDFSSVDIPQEVRQHLEQGELQGLDCGRLIAQLYVLWPLLSSQFSRPSHKRSVLGLGLGAIAKRQAPATQGQCVQLTDMAQEVPELLPCNYISKLTLGLRLSNDYWSGTWDQISANFSSNRKGGFHAKPGTALDIGKEVNLGTEKWENVDLGAFFGSKVVSVRDINTVDLNDLNLYGDEWKLQGIVLVGQCDQSSKLIAVERFKEINEWVGHSGKNKDVETVWKAHVSLKDWVEVSERPKFKQPKDEFRK